MLKAAILFTLLCTNYAFQQAILPNPTRRNITAKNYMKNETTPKAPDESVGSSERRQFFGKMIASSIGFGMAHGANSFKNCDDNCVCDTCSYVYGATFGVPPAYAYERDVGDNARSADSAAQNRQVSANFDYSKYICLLVRELKIEYTFIIYYQRIFEYV